MKKNKDILIVGFALFSIFFGAGNLIFPPFIGMVSGSNWLTSFSGFRKYFFQNKCFFTWIVNYNTTNQKNEQVPDLLQSGTFYMPFTSFTYHFDVTLHSLLVTK